MDADSGTISNSFQCLTMSLRKLGSDTVRVGINTLMIV